MEPYDVVYIAVCSVGLKEILSKILGVSVIADGDGYWEDDYSNDNTHQQ